MMFRCLLLIALLAAFASAEMAKHHHHKHHHHAAHHHHRHPHHHKKTQMLALDQLIKRKPAVHFLGRGFVNRALMSQQGDNKFLKLNGKEERDMNGTISINKNNVLVDLTETKDGHFTVQNLKRKIVGRVDMHSGTNKHLTVHKLKNGDQLINGYQYGSGDVNLEKDILVSGPHGAGAQKPTKHLRMHLTQNHDTNGHIEISDIKPRHRIHHGQNIRYRRQAEMPVENPCPPGAKDCKIPAKEAGKKFGEFFRNMTAKVSEKVKEFGRKVKAKVCQFAYDNGQQQSPNQPQQAAPAQGVVTQSSAEATTWGKVADNSQQPGGQANQNALQNFGQKIKGAMQAAARKLVSNCTNVGNPAGQPGTELPVNDQQTAGSMVVVDAANSNSTQA